MDWPEGDPGAKRASADHGVDHGAVGIRRDARAHAMVSLFDPGAAAEGLARSATHSAVSRLRDRAAGSRAGQSLDQLARGPGQLLSGWRGAPAFEAPDWSHADLEAAA